MNIAWKALRWKILGKWVRFRLDDQPSIKTEQPPVLPPLVSWEEQRVCVALEPPVLGRKDVTFHARFHCGSMLGLSAVFYEHVKMATVSQTDWQEIEHDVRRVLNQHGYYASVLVIFITSDDVWLTGRIQKDRMLFERVVSSQIEYVVGAQARRRGSSYVDAYTVVLDRTVFDALFGAQARVPDRIMPTV